MTSEERGLDTEASGRQLRAAMLGTVEYLDVLMQRAREAAITGQFGHQYMDWDDCDDCEPIPVDGPDQESGAA